MRYLGLASVLALSLMALDAPQAAAQAGAPVQDLNARATTASPATLLGTHIPGAFNLLPRTSRDWIKAEGLRQAQTPRPLEEVQDTINGALTSDIIRLARNESLPPQEVANAVLLVVMGTAEDQVTREIKQARKTPVATDGDQAPEARLAVAHANSKAALKLMSQDAMELLM